MRDMIIGATIMFVGMAIMLFVSVATDHRRSRRLRVLAALNEIEQREQLRRDLNASLLDRCN
jgi:hypothetical protein